MIEAMDVQQHLLASRNWLSEPSEQHGMILRKLVVDVTGATVVDGTTISG